MLPNQPGFEQVPFLKRCLPCSVPSSMMKEAHAYVEALTIAVHLQTLCSFKLEHLNPDAGGATQ